MQIFCSKAIFTLKGQRKSTVASVICIPVVILLQNDTQGITGFNIRKKLTIGAGAQHFLQEIADAQADLSLRRPLEESLDPWLSHSALRWLWSDLVDP